MTEKTVQALTDLMPTDHMAQVAWVDGRRPKDSPTSKSGCPRDQKEVRQGISGRDIG